MRSSPPPTRSRAPARAGRARVETDPARPPRAPARRPRRLAHRPRCRQPRHGLRRPGVCGRDGGARSRGAVGSTYLSGATARTGAFKVHAPSAGTPDWAVFATNLNRVAPTTSEEPLEDREGNRERARRSRPWQQTTYGTSEKPTLITSSRPGRESNPAATTRASGDVAPTPRATYEQARRQRAERRLA